MSPGLIRRTCASRYIALYLSHLLQERDNATFVTTRWRYAFPRVGGAGLLFVAVG